MARIDVVAADTPVGARLISGVSYPLRGTGLATCTVLALIHYVGLLPSYIGAIGSVRIWAASGSLVECLRTRSAPASAWPDHPLRGEIEQQRQRLAAHA